jgi:hypothetical protein
MLHSPDPIIETRTDTVVQVVEKLVRVEVPAPVPDVSGYLEQRQFFHLGAVDVGQELVELLDGEAERLFYTFLELEAKASAARDSAIQTLKGAT